MPQYCDARVLVRFSEEIRCSTYTWERIKIKAILR